MSRVEVPALSPDSTGCVTSRHEKGEGSSFFKQNGIRCGIWFKKIYISGNGLGFAPVNRVGGRGARSVA